MAEEWYEPLLLPRRSSPPQYDAPFPTVKSARALSFGAKAISRQVFFLGELPGQSGRGAGVGAGNRGMGDGEPG